MHTTIMSRLVVALVALFFYLSAVAAAPIPVAYIEKRVTHEGRVGETILVIFRVF